MPPKKKTTTDKKKKTTMSLAAFQQSVPEEDTEGGWGDRMTDDIAIPTEITTDELREISGSSGYNGRYRPPRNNFDDAPRPTDAPTTTYEEYMSQPKERREPRPRQADNQALPTERPFVVYIGNLPFSDLNKEDIADFFGGDKIENIVLPVDREREGRIKGHGYVEFVDIESYKEALSKHNNEFRGRNIRVDVTDPETAQRMCASAKSSRSGGFGGFGGDRFQSGGDREFRDRPKSVSDDDGNWRGGGRSEVSPFGNKNREDRGGFRGGDREGGFRGGDREGGFRGGDREGGFRGGRSGGDREGGFRREGGEERSAFGDKFSDRGGERGGERGGQNRGFNFGRNTRRENQEERSEEPEPLERPKINLKPRTAEDRSPSSAKSSDLFGGGKAWEETDEVRKKMETLELQEKKKQEEASQHLEEEKKKKQEEREKSRQERDNKPRDDRPRDDRPQKKSMDFSNFGKSSGRGGANTTSTGGSRGGRTGAIPTDETGKKDYKKRYENKEKKEETDVKKDTKKDEKGVAQNKFGGFGVLGEEDLE